MREWGTTLALIACLADHLELAAEVHVNVSPSGVVENCENVCLGTMLKQVEMPQVCVHE
jgi:hypothetical protein